MTDSAARSGNEDSTLRRTPRLRRPALHTLGEVRAEMARLYVEAKHGRRQVQDASRLANILALLGRLIEGGEFERRLRAVEQAQADSGREA